MKPLTIKLPGQKPVVINFTDEEFMAVTALAEAGDFDALDKFLMKHKPEFFDPILEYWAQQNIED